MTNNLPLFISYVVVCLVSLNVCIEGARRMNLSVKWAIFWGILFTPASGLAYLYMFLSGDRKLWRVALMTIGIYIILASVVVAVLGIK
jgi:hypothetical protein